MKIPRNGQRIDKGSGIFGDIEIPDISRSGFDMSYTNNFNGHMGMLYPSFWSFVYPNDSISLRQGVTIDSLPLLSPLFDNLDICCEAFYTPMSSLDPLWKNFITGAFQPGSVSLVVPTQPLTIGTYASAGTSGDLRRRTNSKFFSYGALCDFLGYGHVSDTYDSQDMSTTLSNRSRLSAYPLLSYWRIIFDWYQNKPVQDIERSAQWSLMSPYSNFFTNPTTGFSKLYYNVLADVSTTQPRVISLTKSSSYDPFDYVGKPWVRLYDRDFLTTAIFSPSSSSVQVESSGSFTLQSFREAVALDKFGRRNDLAGSIYSDNINAHFGIKPDEDSFRARYLGSFRIPLKNQTVVNNSSGSDIAPLGKKSSTFYGDSAGSVIDNVTFSEHGIVMSLVSINVPSFWCGWSHRELWLNTKPRADWFSPEFNNVSAWSSVVHSDVYSLSTNQYVTDPIGYNEYLWFMKSRRNEVHGQLADSSQSSMFSRSLAIEDSANLGSLHAYQHIRYQELEAKLFADPDSLDDVPPFIFNVNNSCYMVRPLPQHSDPLV